ncbi:hypothetical protein SAMN04488055_4972 [Chitinophaga niabensis]|uniref:Uncharacterized protein n=1 Tax=Chitinophaga niabensis TaxID=536979 RepID=A0A1N6K2X0_9BACT|nr:hypothetical protein SAMN04488055_4972 [Chitinophaga niabensis]
MNALRLEELCVIKSYNYEHNKNSPGITYNSILHMTRILQIY